MTSHGRKYLYTLGKCIGTVQSRFPSLFRTIDVSWMSWKRPRNRYFQPQLHIIHSSLCLFSVLSVGANQGAGCGWRGCVGVEGARGGGTGSVSMHATYTNANKNNPKRSLGIWMSKEFACYLCSWQWNHLAVTQWLCRHVKKNEWIVLCSEYWLVTYQSSLNHTEQLAWLSLQQCMFLYPPWIYILNPH